MEQRSLLSRVKTRLALWHAVLIDLLHLPLRRPGVDPFFKVYTRFVETVAAIPAPVVVELGSRQVRSSGQRHNFAHAAHYIGVDIHPGEGVDLVGDAHRLSALVEPGSVDALYSVSVFEHLVYPWKAVMEINRVLKPGGLVFISTHPAWPPHELPWDFWRFPAAGLAHLFIAETGFELVTATEGLPAKIYSLSKDPPTRGILTGHVNLAVALIARKVGDYDPDRLRWDIDVADVVRSEYPRPG